MIMKNRFYKSTIASVAAAAMVFSLTACGKGSDTQLNTGEFQEVEASALTFPLAEKATLTGMISYPAGTESNPNNRTIFKRLQEETNVEIAWTAYQSDQWGDKITLAMANTNTLDRKSVV